MHEQSIARQIIAEAQKHGRVKKAVVECGALAHLPAKDLQKVMQEMAPFDVEVMETPALVECPSCGFRGEPQIEMHSHDASIFFCKKCSAVPKILEGEDIRLKSVEVEE